MPHGAQSAAGAVMRRVSGSGCRRLGIKPGEGVGLAQVRAARVMQMRSRRALASSRILQGRRRGAAWPLLHGGLAMRKALFGRAPFGSAAKELECASRAKDTQR